MKYIFVESISANAGVCLDKLKALTVILVQAFNCKSAGLIPLTGNPLTIDPVSVLPPSRT